jgi:large subunit ribosomal protein L2
MFIKHIFIKTIIAKTPSQRFKKTIFLLKYPNLQKPFKYYNKNKAGRNNVGRITIYSKGFKTKQNTIPLTYPSVWDNRLSLIVSIFRNKKKLFTLNKHLSGSLSVKPLISGTNVGQFIFSSNLPTNYWFNKLPGNLVLLKFLNKYTIFSNVYLSGYRKIALSNGTYCQILESFLEFNLVKITLPSKKTKIFSSWSFVFLGKNSKENHIYTRVGKAGFNYLLGKKPKVRGVARNPVDHPHGGRTKTNQPEVSIWG